MDIVFQSIAGTEAANASFGVNLKLLGEAHAAARSLKRGTVGENVMYFETDMQSHLGIATHRAEAPVHAILCKPQKPPALEHVTEENPSLSASPSATRSCGSYLRQVIPHRIQPNVWHSEHCLIKGNLGQN